MKKTISQPEDDSCTLDLTWSTRSLKRQVESKRRVGLTRSCMTVKTLEDSLKKAQVSKQCRNKRSISFGDIEVRSHEMILGDNPSVSKGPPVSISWEPFSFGAYTVDNYEADRGSLMRGYHEMKMPSTIRFDLLSKTTKTSEMIKRTKEMTVLKRQRAETITQLYRAKSEEKIELFVRGFKNLVTNKKKKEREYLSMANVISAV